MRNIVHNLRARRRSRKMISLVNVSKAFGERDVLKDVNLTVFEGECIALVGANGSGKSTLLKILAGMLKADQGKVEMLSDLKVAYFPQEISLDEQKKTARELLARLMGVEPNEVAKEIAALLGKLRFPAQKLDFSIEALSGGEKSKLMLMLILSSKANIFLLDEPTNNLDLRGLILLENFAMSNPHGFLIVSHDRKFLDRLVTGIVEINDKTHKLEVYPRCGYENYLKERQSKEKREIAAYQDYAEEKKRLEETARNKKEEARKIQRGPKKPRDKDKYVIGFKKDRSKKISRQASSIEKRLEKMEDVKRPRQPLPLNLKFAFSERSGDIVFRVKAIKMKRDGFKLGPMDLEINYADRIAIIGPNGEGKSTLLKLLIGEVKPDNGFISTGARVKIGYLPQETILNSQDAVLDCFLKQTEFNETNSRRTLARFGFSASEIKTEVKELSPGERSRLVLAILMACEVNCLILDEPTNHLDPEAFDRLEWALKNFAGTIILVSHDRHLIDRIRVNKTYLMEDGKLSFLTNYHEYEKQIFSRD